mmetsp:Transcript_5272/g.9335  ORF Transcript_5272/g.9335 Transcript_5272/m.9335 type:complete len:1060 (+) Transcript_5272:314-3493(+)|eukprot:CAMPEP_0203758704 /NCGR_PEP_ID=MMETSP0098-20131031/11528_1 /ASSEMBLY_ACC=CAM_ASM_000208 /TAXON_ID=96639 /ORGANISM=" , Strain NY0313808BC1" /LENGTH=1059 /DNA_ID=CAMNT_0050651249 /DNA_START=329 /DNA_END=3508 /DNA_ORIENTATION=-
MTVDDLPDGMLKRKLDNGFSVLGLNNSKAHSVYLRLVVRVGSLDEQDDESGVAHFIEHLGFRGTKSHENGSLNQFIESLGCSFGADLNAKTGLTETIWMLNVPVRENCGEDENRDKLVSSLQILGEWAHSIRISDEDVEKERNVIEEEYRMKRGSAQRIKDQYWREVMPRVGSRIPIGSLQVIRNVSSKELRTFYKRHYRPEKMYLVAVGNLDAVGGSSGLYDLLNARGIFKWPEPPVGRAIMRVPHSLPNRVPIFCLLPDNELTSTVVSLEIYSEILTRKETQGVAFLRRDILKRVFSSVLENRLSDLSARPTMQEEEQEETKGGGVISLPWLSAGVSFNVAINDSPTECTSLSAQCVGAGGGVEEKELGIKQAIYTLIREVVRLYQFGFSCEEVDFAKKKWEHVFQRRLVPESSDSLCLEFAEELVQYCSMDEKTPLGGHEAESKFALEILGQGVNRIDHQELWDFAKDAFHSVLCALDGAVIESQNVAFVLQGPAVDEMLGKGSFSSIVQASLRSCLRDAKSGKLAQWKFQPPLESHDDILTALLPHKVSVLDTSYNRVQERLWKVHLMEKLGARTFVLSNGIRVTIKDTSDICPNRISFQGFALGGSAALSDVEDAAYSMLSNVVQSSGVGFLDDLSLSKIESSNRTSVRFQHHWFHRGIGGSCPKEKLSLLLQMTAAWFLAHDKSSPDVLKKLDHHAFERRRQVCMDDLSSTENVNSPELFHAEKIRSIMMGEHEALFRKIDKDMYKAVTIDLIEELYHDAFSRDPTEFTFVFSGDFSGFEWEGVGNRLETYLGGKVLRSPPREVKSKWWHGEAQLPRSMRLSFPEKRHVETFTFGSSLGATDGVGSDGNDHINEGKAQVVIGHKLEFHDIANELELDLASRANCMIVQIRLLERLRTRNSLIYTVGCELSRNSLSNFGIVFTSMSCRGDSVSTVLEAVFDELESLGDSTYDSVAETVTVKKQLHEWHKRATQNNSYWLFWMLDAWKRQNIDCLESGTEAAISWVDDNASQVAVESRFLERVDKTLSGRADFFSTYFNKDNGTGVVLLPLSNRL